MWLYAWAGQKYHGGHIIHWRSLYSTVRIENRPTRVNTFQLSFGCLHKWPLKCTYAHMLAYTRTQQFQFMHITHSISAWNGSHPSRPAKWYMRYYDYVTHLAYVMKTIFLFTGSPCGYDEYVPLILTTNPLKINNRNAHKASDVGQTLVIGGCPFHFFSTLVNCNASGYSCWALYRSECVEGLLIRIFCVFSAFAVVVVFRSCIHFKLWIRSYGFE